MLRRALPLVLAALVIAPALAQTPDRSPTFPRDRRPSAQAQATVLSRAARLAAQDAGRSRDERGAGERGGAARDRGRHAGPERHGAVPPQQLRQGAVQHAGRAGQGSRRRRAASSRATATSSPNGATRTRADITNSVTKTFLTTVVGLAWQRGLIQDVNDYARDYMPPHVDLFESPHNQKIKWDHLLRQTSDWQGTLWGKPDWADRPVGETPDDWRTASCGSRARTSSTTTCGST